MCREQEERDTHKMQEGKKRNLQADEPEPADREGSGNELSRDATIEHSSGRIEHHQEDYGEMADVLRGILTRMRLPWLLAHHSHVVVLALFSFVSSCISIGLMSALALLTRSPFVFPSLGPTAFLFYHAPTSPRASPRNAILGHAIGAGAGYLSLVVTGLTMAGPALFVGVTWPRVIAVAFSLGITAGAMILLRTSHPPACSTALIVSLGLLSSPWQLLLLMSAVVLLTLQAIVINRIAGIPYPLWSAPRPSHRKIVAPDQRIAHKRPSQGLARKPQSLDH